MAAIIGSNVKIEIQAGITADSPPLVISAITKANPGVVTASGHSMVAGDIIKFAVSDGMVQLDGQAVRVSNVSGPNFTLENLDTSTYDTWTTGTVDIVTQFATYAAAQNISMPNPAPVKLDTTTLIDTEKQYVFGMPDAPDGSATALFNPGGTAEALIKAATRTNSSIVVRITFAHGQKRIFNAFVSGGSGFTMGVNAVAQATIAFTPIRQVLDYTI
jgi:hypothetical protein